MEKKRIIPVQLSSSNKLFIEISPLESSFEEIALGSYNFDKIESIIKDLSQKIINSIESCKPQKASVEFGIDATVESGDLTAILVKGSINANIKITLEWERK